MDYKRADFVDAELLYRWATDPETRANSLSQSAFDFPSHCVWLKEKLIDPNVVILIFSDGGQVIGMCRLDKNGDTALISYSVDRAFRGRGYGRKIISEVEQFARKDGIRMLTAIVKAANTASLKIFESLGYLHESVAENYKFYKSLAAKFCLGTVQFGLQYGVASKGKPSESESVEMLEAAVAKGVTAFDTAAAYGMAEEIVGKFFCTNPQLRNAVAVATKTPPNLFSGLKPSEYYDTAARALEISLKKLGCGYADYYLLHTSADVFNPDIAIAMQRLTATGLTKTVGVSVYAPSEAMQALKTTEYGCIQIPYNAIDRRLDETGFFAASKKMKIFCRSVLLQGLLAMNLSALPPRLSAAHCVLEMFDSICRCYDVTRVQAAVSFVAQKKEIDYIIIGVDNLSQLDEQIALFKNKINTACIKQIESSFAGVADEILNPALWRK